MSIGIARRRIDSDKRGHMRTDKRGHMRNSNKRGHMRTDSRIGLVDLIRVDLIRICWEVQENDLAIGEAG